MFKSLVTLALLATAAFAAPQQQQVTPNDLRQPLPIFTTRCGGQRYDNLGLAGYGFVPSNFRDKFGDTISIGSSMAVRNWVKNGDVYTGTLYGLPDRGWNTNGTINYNPRVHIFRITFTLSATNPTPARPSDANLQFSYQDSILLKGPNGFAVTGLDADLTGSTQPAGFPALPLTTFTGDGYGGAGPGGQAIPIDAEGLYVDKDGSYWVSDEYGPYVYKFDSAGVMTAAIRPPDAILPVRNGTVSFSANSPPRYDPGKRAFPANPTQGRQNNQGFEGLTFSPDGQTLYVLLQSAGFQEGGSSSSTRRYTRFLQYSLASGTPTLTNEYVVPLPTYINIENNTRIAAQSEVHYISPTQFLILSRDSGSGGGLANTRSFYRRTDVFDISNATNVVGATYNSFNGSIASRAGVLNPEIRAATYCPFVDMNNNTELARFRLHNGGAQDPLLLNEKWEALALLPVRGLTADRSADTNGEYFLFQLSDNDFITQDGYFNNGRQQYQDASGVSLNNQAMIWRVQIPKTLKPYIG